MTFKTGDKGQTRGGTPYHVIYISHKNIFAILDFDEATPGENISVECYEMDGRAFEHRDAPRDLLPPKQKIERVMFVCALPLETTFFDDKQAGLDYYNALTAPQNIVAIVPVSIPYTEGEGL